MTIEQLKKEAASLPVRKQTELIAYLVHLRNQRNPEFKRRLNDRNPKHWLTLDEVKERLSKS